MINLFFSYAHEDEVLRNELDKHLSILKKNGIISSWHDRRILTGTEFDKEITNYLKNADIILLLISTDFIASDYCYDREMKYAMEKHEKGEAVVLPVILRPCDWKDTPFGKLLAAPTDGKPVIKFSNLDEAFLEITNQIKRIVSSLNKSPEINEIERVQPIFTENKPLLRSSNLRIKKIFSDRDKDWFLEEAFDYIANFFEGSLKELKNRNSEIEYRFRRIDSQTCTANIYIEGKVVSECMFFYGTDSFMPDRISYCRSISQSKNSCNESLRIEDDGYILYLTASGMSVFGRSNREEKMTNEGAAEYFWQMLIEPLQRN